MITIIHAFISYFWNFKKKHKKTEKSRLERSVYSMSKCPKCVTCKVYQCIIRRAYGPSKGASTK